MDDDVFNGRYDDLKNLVEKSDLRDIQFHELSAKLYDDPPEVDHEASEADVDIKFQTRIGEDDFGVRVSTTVGADTGTATAVVAADYDIDSQHLPDNELVTLFATEIAMMAVFPYIREGIQSATTRVFGSPLILPIMRRGDFSAEPEE